MDRTAVLRRPFRWSQLLGLTRAQALLAAAFVAAWWAGCWAISGYYFDGLAAQAYRAESRRADEFVANTARGIERLLSVRSGVPAVLARDGAIGRILGRFGVGEVSSPLPYEERKRLWTTDPSLSATNRVLDMTARDLALSQLYLLDAAGDCVAASNAGTDRSFVGTNYSDREYFQAPRSGRSGRQVTVGRRALTLGVIFSSPVVEKGRFLGAVVGRIDLSQFADRINQADAFLTDKNGVVVLARDESLEMRALPEAAVRTLDAQTRAAIYKQTDFPDLPFGSTGDARYPGLMRMQGRAAPFVTRTRPLPADGLAMTVMWPLPQIVEFRQQRIHLAVAAGVIGALLIVLGLGGARYVRDMRASHRALARSEAELRSLAVSSPGLMGSFWRRPDGTVCMPFTSPRIWDLYGLRPEEVAQDASRVLALTHPDDAERVEESIAQSARAMTPWRIEFRILHPTRGEVWLEGFTNPEPHPDGGVVWHGLILDITERKRMEQALSDSRNFLNNVLDTIADPIFVKDRQHRWVLLNQAFCGFIGHPRLGLLGKSDFDFFPRNEAEVFWEKDELVLETGQESVNEEAFTDGEGVRHTIVTTKSRYTDAAGQPFIVGIIRDITERKVVEAAREAALAEAMRLAQARSGFLSQMSHELRTPLNGILGFAQLLQLEGAIDEEQRAWLDIIERSGNHLLSLIVDILDHAKLEADKVELDLGDIPLDTFLGTVAAIVRVKAEQKKLAFLCEAAADLPGVVRGDEKRLRQVVLNLLANAVKFTDRGQVILRVGCPAPGRLRFEVRDSGVGIAEDQLEAIFRPFEQVGEAGSQASGTGLGLAISRKLVRLMGGDIEAESRLGEGSVFSFELEMEVVESQPLASDVLTALAVPTLPAAVAPPLAPPAHELEVLRGLARRGNMRNIVQRAAYLAELDVRYLPFADQLRQMARAYQSKAIVDFVEQYLERMPGT